MTVVSRLDVHGLTAQEYRAVMGQLGVETRPEGGICLHLTTPIEDGSRVVQIWDEKEGFDRFVEQRLAPASEAVGLDREITITVTPLHNFFRSATHRAHGGGSFAPRGTRRGAQLGRALSSAMTTPRRERKWPTSR
jgi:hypothetical protein